ncbi:carbohydrate esterase family 12 protein [Cylindrobasidium torrendii FP15055 ss-10]|uniref:Carbohydrate esterase family 12 protein n=1 Tax=Cylindrobasidium torrendii FP15055 ss-10 TaxID=1314674 RepID=A0A0D7BM01_9AGAR|nr:carbohydrate esterase family 12 protein [Cylindrobasidium torrendii FP15055 ss-10]
MLVAAVILQGLVASVVGKTAFVLIGDSTTANGTSVNSGGWGNGFCGSEVNGTASALEEGTPCINTAHNGASTGSFVDDGFWDISIAQINAQLADGLTTYATIQFGHNDQKVGDAALMGDHLVTMVEEIVSLGAIPILVTPLTRRSFGSDGTISDTLQDFADATVGVANQESVHVIDLHATSIKYCEAIGEEACHRLNKSPDDNTHLNNDGSVVFGRMVADLILESFPDAGLPIVANEALSYNISHGIPSY